MLYLEVADLCSAQHQKQNTRRARRKNECATAWRERVPEEDFVQVRRGFALKDKQADGKRCEIKGRSEGEGRWEVVTVL
jgi:hypothetical protein